jgi:hypothetical protein
MGIGCDWFWWQWDFVLTFDFCWTITFVFYWTTTYVFCWTLPSMDMFYLIGILDSSTFNFHVVNRMLIICESSIGVFLHLTLLQLYLWYYILHIIISYTCWVPTISVLNLAISLYCTNLLLRSWRRFGILWWGILDEWLPPVDCMWSYGVVPLLCLRECSL